MSQPTIIPVRAFFQKIGRVKYLSHLDTMRAFTRTISRSQLPVWYTEGYNPRLHISFAMALSLGYEGRREVFDLRLTQVLPLEELRQTFNRYLPEELSIIQISAPDNVFKDITWADYTLLLYPALPSEQEALTSALEHFFAQKELVVLKETKRHRYTQDIRNYILQPELHQTEDAVCVKFRTAVGSGFTINPRAIMDVFLQSDVPGVKHIAYTREGFFDSLQKPFT